MEDHIGDMDFKVAGTSEGITAIQLDIKVKSIGYDVVRDALEQAREARETILENIEETIPAYRADLSPYAPRMETIQIAVDKIGAVIGPGGKMIRGIVEETGATVDIQDDGTIIIGSSDGSASAQAIQMIRDLTKDVEIGEIYTGKVVRTTDFGAFVELLPGKDGMVHISELANYRVPTVEDEVNVGDEITVMVIDLDPAGRVRLSRRALLGDGEEDGDPLEAAQRRQRAGRGGGGPRRGGGGPRRDGDGGPRNRDSYGSDRGPRGRDRDSSGGDSRPRNRDSFGGDRGPRDGDSSGRDRGPQNRDRDSGDGRTGYRSGGSGGRGRNRGDGGRRRDS